METQSVVDAGLEVIELLVLVGVLEMTAQVRDVPIVFPRCLHRHTAASYIANVAESGRHNWSSHELRKVKRLGNFSEEGISVWS